MRCVLTLPKKDAEGKPTTAKDIRFANGLVVNITPGETVEAWLTGDQAGYIEAHGVKVERDFDTRTKRHANHAGTQAVTGPVNKELKRAEARIKQLEEELAAKGEAANPGDPEAEAGADASIDLSGVAPGGKKGRK